MKMITIHYIVGFPTFYAQPFKEPKKKKKQKTKNKTKQLIEGEQHQ